MKRISLLFFTGIVALLLTINFSCSKASGTTSGGTDSVLLNIGNNIILPSYNTLAINADSLDSAIVDFNSNPDAGKLSRVRLLFTSTYVSWQSVSEYDYFGPAADGSPALSTINIFPTSATTIDNNITNNDDNVNAFANTAAQGLPALDYLLFGTDSTVILTKFTTDGLAANRKNYLAAVITALKTAINNSTNNWSSGGGNYIATFVNGAGTSVSSSLGLLLNSMDEDFEILKNDRLGIPLGKIPAGSSLPLAPTEVEALYSGVSVRLAQAQLTAIEGIYFGTGQQGNGSGLKNYLIAAEQQRGLRYHGGLLSDTLAAAFTQMTADLQAIPDPLSATIQTNSSNAIAAFNEAQLLTTLLKTDLPSDLMVSINYGDNDGD